MSRPLTLLESAELTGHYRYVELALFRALGAAATGASEPATASYLAAAARAHGFRARLIEELLPVSLGLPGIEASTRAPHPSVDAAIAAMVAPGPDGALLAALVGVVYPAMLGAYSERVAVSAPASDAPLLRTLRRVIGDLDATRQEGLALVAATEEERATAVAALITEAGGPFGALPLAP